MAPLRPSAGALPLLEAARWVGRAVWRELRAFEVLGGWVTSVPEPEAKVLLDTTARHCAWRAGVLRDHLPRLREIDVEALVAPEGPHVERFFRELAAGPTDGDVTVAGTTAARLAGAYRVLAPRVITSTAGRLARAQPVADAPLARLLRLVLDDQLHDWQAGEALLQELLVDERAVAAVVAWQGQLEAGLVAGGGFA